MKELLQLIKRQFLDLSLLNKLTIAYAFSIFIPVSIVIPLQQYEFKKYVESEMIQSDKQTLLQLKDNMLNKVDITLSVSMFIAYNPTVLNFLSKEYQGDSYSVNEYMRYIVPLITNAAEGGNGLIKRISIFTTNDTIYEHHNVVLSHQRILGYDWYKSFLDREDIHMWRHPHEIDEYKAEGLTDKDRERVFSLVTKIKGINNKILGVIIVDIPENRMFPGKDSPNRNKEDNGDVVILNYANETIFQEGSFIDTDEKRLISASIEEGRNSFIKDNYLYSFVSLYDGRAPLNIKLLRRVSIQNLTQRSVSTSRNMILVFILGMFLLLSVTYIIVKAMIARLKQIVSTMNEVAKGNFDKRIPIHSKDEIGQLAGDFNVLISKINELIKDVLKKETSQKDAQLMALQYQINPHFIYNTFDIFRAKLELQGVNDVADAIGKFGRIFRYNLGGNSKYATLGDEIRHIKDYIDLQKLRYGEMINLQVHMPDHFKDILVIKFILQPVVENSIKHGFRDKSKKFSVSIDFEWDKKYVKITVTDNGMGINPRRLDELNYQLRYSKYPLSKNSKDGSIGLANINDRIKLFYGDGYYMQMESVSEQYTRTVLRLPYPMNTGEYNVQDTGC